MKKLTPIYETAERENAEFTEQDGWQVANNYGDVAAETAAISQSVALCDQSHHGKFLVKGTSAAGILQAEDLAIHAGKITTIGRIYRLREDLFFVWTEAQNSQDTADALSRQASDSADLISVTDVTHGNAELWLIGPKSAELLGRLCGLDLRDSQFPNGVAKQTSVAKTTQLIIRSDLSDQPAYALIGPRSLGAYLWDTILKAGQDLGVKPAGLAALIQSRE